MAGSEISSTGELPYLQAIQNVASKKKAGDHEVLPGVERPLAVPGELDGIGEWLEVRDGPLVAVGAAGADEVAQQMQVEADEDQERGESWVRGRAAD